jgi:hypothetical protein
MIQLIYLFLLVVIIGFGLILFGIVSFFKGTNSAESATLKNRYLAGGLLAMVIGSLGFSLTLKSWLGPSSDSGPVAEKFSLTSVYPGPQATVPQSAIGRWQFNSQIPAEAVKAITISEVGADGQWTVVPGWPQLLEEARPSDGRPMSLLVFRPLVVCTQSTLRQTCFKPGTYKVSIDKNSITSLTGEALADCGASGCQWEFKVIDQFDKTPPAISLEPEHVLPAGPAASLNFNIKGEDAPLTLELWLNRRLVGQKLLGTTTVLPGESKLEFSIKDLKAKERNFLNLTAIDSSGNTAEAGSALEVYAPHCLNQQLDADEYRVDCGGNDCRLCY